MDAVISYVNGCEKVWRTEFNKYSTFMSYKFMLYYDWGTLKYLLRGISTYMPYIKNVFLVVSNIEQVPDYVNQENVKIVLYKDFIPGEYLPTFNPCIVELFMHRIEGLDEQFIYFNQNTVPISSIAFNDLIYNGTPCMSFESNNFSLNDNSNVVNISFLNTYLTIKRKTEPRTEIPRWQRIQAPGDGIGAPPNTHCFYGSNDEE